LLNTGSLDGKSFHVCSAGLRFGWATARLPFHWSKHFPFACPEIQESLLIPPSYKKAERDGKQDRDEHNHVHCSGRVEVSSSQNKVPLEGRDLPEPYILM
jgi:hypothetical protein